MKPYLEYALELHQQGDLNKADIARRVQEHYSMHDRNVETLRKKNICIHFKHRAQESQ